MQAEANNSTGFLRQIRLIHFSMITGVVVFLVVCLYFTLSESSQVQVDTEYTSQLFIITAVLTVVLLPASYVLFKRRLSGIKRDNIGLNQILLPYKTAYLVKMSLIEMPAFFSIVVLLLTGNQWLLIQIIAVLLVMIINRPSAERIISELKLDRSQIQELQNL